MTQQQCPKDREVETVGDALAGIMTRRGAWFAGGLLAFVVINAYIGGHRKPLWYDELFSVIVAIQPTWNSMKGAMAADGNPPVYALLTKLCLHLFGSGDFSIRLPSLLGFLGALSGVYVYIRRECGPLYGLLAMVLVLAQPGWTYSYEARPYALMLAWVMLALVSWQAATRTTGARGLALAGIATALAGGILTHNLGIVMVGVPLLAGESVRIVQRRRADWPMLATGLAVLTALAITLPMMRRTNLLLLGFQHNYLHPLTWAKFVHYGIVFPLQSFPEVVSIGLVGWMVVIVVITWRVRGKQNPSPQAAAQPATPGYILAAAVACALLMPITWAVMMSTTGYYLSRYGIGTIAGLALVACLLAHRTQRAKSILPIAVLSLLALDLVTTAIHARAKHPILPVDQLVYAYPSDLPVVVNDPYRYLPMWWYAPASAKSRLIYLEDRPEAIRNGYIIVEAALVAQAPYLPMHFAAFDRFLATHDDFLLDSTGTANNNLPQRIQAAGYTLTTVASDNINGVLFHATRLPRITR